MSTLYLTRGIPASGKTHWSKLWQSAKPNERLRINRDDLRRMLHGVSYGLDWAAEQNITRIQRDIATDALKRGLDVIIDDTNLRAKYVREWLTLWDQVEFVDFPITLETALARDAAREHTVGDEVVRRFYDRFTNKGVLLPVPERPAEKAVGRIYEPDPQLTSAFIFDIDGTLAHIPVGGRSPYDGTRVHEDTLDVGVAHILERLREWHYIVIMSGRDAKYRAATEKWLRDNGVAYDELFMRPEGDTRKDHVVKLELFDEHIRHRFNVLGVFDDRDRVVAGWRSIGLKCYQVAEGNF